MSAPEAKRRRTTASGGGTPAWEQQTFPQVPSTDTSLPPEWRWPEGHPEQQWAIVPVSSASVEYDFLAASLRRVSQFVSQFIILFVSQLVRQPPLPTK